jgi:hypothetical protein
VCLNFLWFYPIHLTAFKFKPTDNYEKMVISMDDVSLGNRNGIIHAVACNTEIYK